MRRTKIVCTIGPASRAPERLHGLLKAGMDVARFNLAHASPAQTARTIREIRRQARALGRNVAVLADLPGPKIRITELPQGPVELAKGDRIWLAGTAAELRRSGAAGSAGPAPAAGTAAAAAGATTRTARASAVAGVGYARISRDVPPRRRVLVADGLIILESLEAGPRGLLCRVVEGGTLESRMGVTIPGVPLTLPSITAEDKAHLAFAVRHSDWLAMSFVRGPETVAELRRLVARESRQLPIIAKIERPEAVRHLPAILEAADGVMVARGDLGVQLPAERVPLLQKEIIDLARRAAKPVITATQMFESMIREPRPTRAEVSDVANAVLDGTDAVMLSGETAMGAYPVEAVQWMAKVAREAEKRPPAPLTPARAGDPTGAIAAASVELAAQLKAAAIVTATQSGHTARRVASHRPPVPVLAVSPSADVVRRLALSWGVVGARVPPSRNIEHMLHRAVVAAVDAGLVRKGDRLVLTAGVMVNVPGTTNLIKVQVV